MTAIDPLTKEVRDWALARGRAEGHAEGCAEILTKQLTMRFGPLSKRAQRRLRTATADQLDAWAERVRTASSLADVFAER